MQNPAHPIVLDVAQIAGTSRCVAAEDGDKVCASIEGAFNQGQKVELHFRNVQSLSTTFLHHAIGQLYGRFTNEFVRAHLSAPDANASQKQIIKKAMELAKEFFASPENYENRAAQAMETI